MKTQAEVEQALKTISLKAGKHQIPRSGMCAMEALAWINNEPFSDDPKCVDSAIATIVRHVNDRLDDARREKHLKPILHFLVGTRTADINVIRKRMYLAANFVTHVAGPKYSRARGREDLALRLEAVTTIVDKATAIAAREECRAIHAYHNADEITNAAANAAATAVDDDEVAAPAYVAAVAVHAAACAGYAEAAAEVAAANAAHAVATHAAATHAYIYCVDVAARAVFDVAVACAEDAAAATHAAACAACAVFDVVGFGVDAAYIHAWDWFAEETCALLVALTEVQA